MKNTSSKYTSRIDNEYQEAGFRDELDDYFDRMDQEIDEIYGE